MYLDEIFNLMKKYRLSYTEVAKLAGSHRNVIARWAKNETIPKEESIQRLSNAVKTLIEERKNAPKKQPRIINNFNPNKKKRRHTK